jgi:PKD repeat protein
MNKYLAAGNYTVTLTVKNYSYITRLKKKILHWEV